MLQSNNSLLNIYFKNIHCANKSYSLAPVALAVCLAFYSEYAAADIYFNPRFLSDNPEAVADLSAFEKGQELPAGSYRVDVYLNDGFISTRDITFEGGKDGLVPCFTVKELSKMGVNTVALKKEKSAPTGRCMSLQTLVQSATSKFDVGQQKLYITIPQALMKNSARGYISPEYWDDGINSGLLNYNFTANDISNKNGKDSSYAYLNLQSGVNFGAWRFRDNSIWSHASTSTSESKNNKWQHVNSWLERDITSFKSRVILGDSYTSNDVFDGLNYRGVQLRSEDSMLPDSQRGFAPVVRGIAKGTAKVSIKQNGYEIYQTTVPPGPFVIDDLNASGNSGDLQVTIKESDGSSQVFSLPWSTVPVLQREGYSKYALTAGEYRSGSSNQENPKFFQATLLHGLKKGWTVFGGGQFADRYTAFNLGVGKNLGVYGAVSADITQAKSTLADSSSHEGQSMRFLYNKSLNQTGTSFQLVGYRYSTQGYYTLADTAYQKMNGYKVETQDGPVFIEPNFRDYYNLAYNKKGRLQISLAQQLGRTSTLYFSGSHQTYWYTGKSDKQLQVGFNSAAGDVNWSLNYSLAQNAWQNEKDHLFSFNISVPFSHWLRSDTKSVWRNANASFNSNNDFKGRVTNLAGLYGTLLDDQNLSYNVQTGNTSGKQSDATGYASVNYRGPYANANAGYSTNSYSKQFYYGINGGMVVHGDGVTFSQPINETSILVKAPGASNVKVENQSGIKTDWRGYAVIPYATAYRENRVALDTNSLADNLDFDDAVSSLVPTHGAIARASFKPRVGVKLLAKLERNGIPLPFGATATSDSNGGASIVSDNGQVYMSGMPQSGTIKVKWGNDSKSSCVAKYNLPKDSLTKALVNITAECI